MPHFTPKERRIIDAIERAVDALDDMAVAAMATERSQDEIEDLADQAIVVWQSRRET